MVSEIIKGAIIMLNKRKNVLKRTVAASLALLLASGAAPFLPGMELGTISAEAFCGRDTLSGRDLELYDLLKEKIIKIASGEETSSVINITFDDFKLTWSASELGVTSFNTDAGKGIKVQGKINTRSGIVMGAGNIAIENGAVLKSQKDLNFASLVNTQDAAGAAFSNIGMTAVAEDKSGDIILRSQTSHEFINNPLLPGVETYDSIANVHNDASVAVRGEISGDGNVDIIPE